MKHFLGSCDFIDLAPPNGFDELDIGIANQESLHWTDRQRDLHPKTDLLSRGQLDGCMASHDFLHPEGAGCSASTVIFIKPAGDSIAADDDDTPPVAVNGLHQARVDRIELPNQLFRASLGT
ncbi:MAG TPA: hypothetical protein VK900_21000 [Anaerolineales bacterium]|nr:hypothetical protein [Anaerolineales bacterium]